MAALCEYPTTVASVAIEREYEDEPCVFFARIKDPASLSLQEIHSRIRYFVEARSKPCPCSEDAVDGAVACARVAGLTLAGAQSGPHAAWAVWDFRAERLFVARGGVVASALATDHDSQLRRHRSRWDGLGPSRSTIIGYSTGQLPLGHSASLKMC